MIYYTVLWRENNKWKAFTISGATKQYAFTNAVMYAFVRNGIVIYEGRVVWTP